MERSKLFSLCHTNKCSENSALEIFGHLSEQTECVIFFYSEKLGISCIRRDKQIGLGFPSELHGKIQFEAVFNFNVLAISSVWKWFLWVMCCYKEDTFLS